MALKSWLSNSAWGELGVRHQDGHLILTLRDAPLPAPSSKHDRYTDALMEGFFEACFTSASRAEYFAVAVPQLGDHPVVRSYVLSTALESAVRLREVLERGEASVDVCEFFRC